METESEQPAVRQGWRAALYYPYFHVRDQRRWLKVAALYWPTLLRLVPDGFTTHDSDDVRALIDAGFLHSRPPGRTVDTVGADFLAAITAQEAEIRFRYAVERHVFSADVVGSAGPFRDDPSHRRRARSRGGPIRGIHRDMLSVPLAEALLDADLAVPQGEWIGTGQNSSYHRVSSDEWLGVREEIVRVYSGVLAERFCHDQNDLVQPITDQPGAYVAGGADATGIARLLLGHGAEAPPPAQSTAGQTIALLTLGLVVPGRIDEVPVAEIVRIRESYRDELDAFGAAVTATTASLADDIGEVSDPVVLEGYLGHVVNDRFAGPLKDLRAALRALTWGAATMAIDAKTVLPAGVATLVPSLAGQPVIGAAAGTALALVSAGHSYTTQRRAALTGHPEISFLLHTGRRVTRRRTLRRLAARFRS